MRKKVVFVPSVLLLAGCGSVAPPPSAMPDAKTAVARLDATYGSVSGISGSAKIVYLGKNGRVRGDVSVLASGPASLRFAISADVIGVAGEVASNGILFQADDKANGRYVVGPAKPCNIAKITQVPLPSKELVPMLWGMRPHLDGPISCDSISWNGDGHYVVMLGSAGSSSTAKSSLSHELHVAPWPSDWDQPYGQQRLRLLGVLAWDRDTLVYRVTMKDHQKTVTAKPIVDEEGLSPDVPPSGPQVEVEVPRAIHVEVPDKGSDVTFHYREAFVNPPLLPNAFQLVLRPGVPVQESNCE